jgi:hypothetical protein
MKKTEPHNPLKMVSDPYSGDTFILPETLCTDERRLWFKRTNEIIAFLMTTELAIKDTKTKYEQILARNDLRPETPMKIESSDGRSLVCPAHTLIKQFSKGVDVLCRQVFIMLYGSLETYMFQLMERSFPEIGITESILDQSLEIMMRRKWDSKFCKMSDVFGLGYMARDLNNHFTGFEMNFEGQVFKNPLIFLDELAKIRHKIVHASSILEEGRLIFINAKVFHSYFAFVANLTEFIDSLFVNRFKYEIEKINPAEA